MKLDSVVSKGELGVRTGRRTAGVAAGKRSESVLQEVGVCLRADGRSYEHPVLIEYLAYRVDGGLRNSAGGQVWLAARQQIRSRLAEQVLHALGN